MERLTDRCWRNLDPWECCGQNFHCSRKLNDDGGCINGCIVPKLYKHLAEYEDLEEQGLLLKLPCKVGDTLYFVSRNKIIEELIVLKITYQDKFIITFRDESNDIGNVSEKYIGKTVFLTKEEAEKALKEMECAE